VGASSRPPPSTASSAPDPSLDALALSSTIFDSSLDAILFTSPDGRVLAANPAACRVLGMSQEEVCRRGRSGLADPADPRWFAASQERSATGQFFGELSMVRGDGSAFPAEVSSAVFEDADGSRRTVVVFRDVSDRKEAEALLKRRACVDELTGALNRRGFFDIAPELLHDAQESEDMATLLFVDVDGLKDLNDNWGFGTGDAALREVAGLLREACGSSDLVARFGGDEFLVLSRRGKDQRGTTLSRRVENGFHLRNAQPQPFPLRVSVGEAQLAADGAEALDQALAEAHRAMREKRIRARGGRAPSRRR
jgi:diguanylate cyclase (GGDEF)-like protein/PAS domain S-box-containing protein